MTPALEAVIFDVDGTLVDSERHGHRVAFNEALEEFGLPWQWGEDEYGKLLRVTGGQRRLHTYLEGKGVGQEERDELVPALHARKTEILSAMVTDGRIEVRPGVPRLLDELASAGVTLAVATTGSRGWVDGLLRQVVGDTEFTVVVTGDEVGARKPDPEAFTVALQRLGTTADRAVAVEDSAEGLASATGAGLACVVVVNGYTADHDLSAAELVVDGFGSPGTPAHLLADRVGSGFDGVVDVALLRRVLGSRDAGAGARAQPSV